MTLALSGFWTLCICRMDVVSGLPSGLVRYHVIWKLGKNKIKYGTHLTWHQRALHGPQEGRSTSSKVSTSNQPTWLLFIHPAILHAQFLPPLLHHSQAESLTQTVTTRRILDRDVRFMIPIRILMDRHLLKLEEGFLWPSLPKTGFGFGSWLWVFRCVSFCYLLEKLKRSCLWIS